MGLLTDFKKKPVAIKPHHNFRCLSTEQCAVFETLLNKKCSLRFISRYMNLPEYISARYRAQYLYSGAIKPKEEYISLPKSLLFLERDTNYIKTTIKKLFKADCSLTIGTVQLALKNLGVSLERKHITKFIRELQYTRKKIRKVEAERNTTHNLILRQKYCRMISQLPLENLIFVDETHFDQRTVREYGWSKIGDKPIKRFPIRNKKRITLLAAFSVRGFEAVRIIKGKYSTKYFLEFLEHYLDHLCPHEILVMDNAAYHHCHQVKEKLQQLHREVRFLPAYSPQLNPIERVFGSIKKRYKKWRQLTGMTLDEMKDLVEKTIQSVGLRGNFIERYFEEYRAWVRKGIQGELFV